MITSSTAFCSYVLLSRTFQDRKLYIKCFFQFQVLKLAEKQLDLGKRVKLQAGLQAYISLHCVEASSLVLSTSGSNLTTSGSDSKHSGLVLQVSGCDSKPSGSNLTFSSCDSKPSASDLTVSVCDSKPSVCSDLTMSGSGLATEEPDIRLRGQKYAQMAKYLGDIAYGNQSDEAKVFEKICQQWNSTPSSDLFSVVQESITKLRDIV